MENRAKRCLVLERNGPLDATVLRHCEPVFIFFLNKKRAIDTSWFCSLQLKLVQKRPKEKVNKLEF